MKKVLLPILMAVSFSVWSQTYNETVNIEDSSNPQLELIQNSSRSWQFRVGTSGSLIFRDDNTEKLRIDENGNLGIGLSNPSEKLVVDGNAKFFVSGSDQAFVIDNSEGGSSGVTLSNSEGSMFYNVGGVAHRFLGNGTEYFTILSDGNVGIGIDNPNQKLVVDGKIRSEEVKVEIINGPDYVFESDYKLRTLKETKEYISENKHLPEIPSAKEMEANGVELGDMNMRLLKKIEELTLYQIELLERLNQQNEQLLEQQKRIEKLENK